MSYDDFKYRYGIIERKLIYLEPHEMTAKELRQALQESTDMLIYEYESIARTQGRIAGIRAQMSNPVKAIRGGGITTPRKKICRIHQWDTITNTRIRGHKHDWRMPTYKGNKDKDSTIVH